MQGAQDHGDRRGNRHSTARERSFREEFPQVSDDIDEYAETCKDYAGIDELQFYNVFGDVIEPQFLQPLLDDAFYARETLADFWRWFEETLRTGDEYVQRGLRGVRLSGWVLPLLAELTRTGTPAMRSRGRKLLARLEQPGLSRRPAGGTGGGMTQAGEDAVQ